MVAVLRKHMLVMYTVEYYIKQNISKVVLPAKIKSWVNQTPVIVWIMLRRLTRSTDYFNPVVLR